MSGHNRWTKIKRKKEAAGAAKGKLFTKLIKEITVAARMGGADPNGNARLRSAMVAAREANMPADNITRAIKKGTGELEGIHYEELTYEGYAPGGVAVIIECLTDNKTRTAHEVRNVFSKRGGNLGETNSVSWMFQRRGAIQVKPGASEDRVMEVALDAGALDVLPGDEGGFEVRTEPKDVHEVAGKLEKAGLPLGAARIVYIPQNTIRLDGDAALRALAFMDAMEDLEDVQNVHANFEIDDAVLDEQAAAHAHA
jgi:YebC/PmpR family DNA-binding regulatory protein